MEKVELICTHRIRVEAESGPNGTLVRLIGILDEDVNLSPVLEFLAAGGRTTLPVLFDLGFVSGMNSCGVREWILFMERIGSRGNVSFVNISEIFVDQANMISNIFGKSGKVVNFHAPYHCGSCNSDVVKLLEPKQVVWRNGAGHAPSFNCPKCAIPLEFDSIEDEYFCFVEKLSDFNERK